MPDTKNNAREFHRLWHAVDRGEIHGDDPAMPARRMRRTALARPLGLRGRTATAHARMTTEQYRAHVIRLAVRAWLTDNGLTATEAVLDCRLGRITARLHPGAARVDLGPGTSADVLAILDHGAD